MSLRHAILGFLSLRPLSGYDLKRAFDTSVRHFWTADQAAIYRTLTELERDGLVTHERIAQVARPDRKLHQLTDAGRAEFAGWLRAPTPSAPRREPLLVKLFFAGPLSDAEMRFVLETELAQVEGELAALTAYAGALEAQAAAAPGDPDIAAMLRGPAITLTNGFALGIAYRNWLAGLIALAAANELTLTALLAQLQRGEQE